MQDFTNMKGVVELTLKDANGHIKLQKTYPNLVVTSGRTFVASRMTGAGAAVMSHMAVGTSATASALGNTALGGELGRVALTSATPTVNVVVYVATFGTGVGTGSLQEAGLFNAGAAGTMLSRTTFPIVNKGASDTLQISWTITVS